MPGMHAVHGVHLIPEDVDDGLPLSHAGASEQSVHVLKRIRCYMPRPGLNTPLSSVSISTSAHWLWHLEQNQLPPQHGTQQFEPRKPVFVLDLPQQQHNIDYYIIRQCSCPLHHCRRA
jgi:hypothetical protein